MGLRDAAWKEKGFTIQAGVFLKRSLWIKNQEDEWRLKTPIVGNRQYLHCDNSLTKCNFDHEPDI